MIRRACLSQTSLSLAPCPSLGKLTDAQPIVNLIDYVCVANRLRVLKSHRLILFKCYTHISYTPKKKSVYNDVT